MHVEIAVARDFDGPNSFDGTHGVQHIGRDDFGGFLQLACELEGDGQRNFAEGRLFRLLSLYWRISVIERFHTRGEGFRDAFFKDKKHETPV